MDNDRLRIKLSQPDVIQRKAVDLKYGGKSKVYFYIKNVLGDPGIRNQLSDKLHELFPEDVTSVFGEGFGGRPLADTISSRYYLKYITSREKEKSYGLANTIEYYTPDEEDSVVIVDDVLSTGGSLKDSIELLEPITNIAGGYVVVDREDIEKIPEYSGDKICGYPFGYLFKSSELI